MQSLLVDVNRIRNLATKNLFVAHEACRRSWKSLILLCPEDDLREDDFTEDFKFDSRPPQNASWHRTPSIEDSEYSSLAATIVARVVDEEDDATSPTMASPHLDTARAPLHHQTPTSTLHLHLLLMGTSRCSMSSNLFGHY